MKIKFYDVNDVPFDSFIEAFESSLKARGVILANDGGHEVSADDFESAQWIYTPKGSQDVEEIFLPILDMGSSFIDPDFLKFDSSYESGETWWYWRDNKYVPFSAHALRALEDTRRAKENSDDNRHH